MPCHAMSWFHVPCHIFGVMGLFFGPLGKKKLESWASFLEPGPFFNDFLKTKKMRNVCTINMAVVSRRDLYYVSENKSFCFGQKIVSHRALSSLNMSPYRAIWTHFRPNSMIFIDLILQTGKSCWHLGQVHDGFTTDSRQIHHRFTRDASH